MDFLGPWIKIVPSGGLCLGCLGPLGIRLELLGCGRGAHTGRREVT